MGVTYDAELMAPPASGLQPQAGGWRGGMVGAVRGCGAAGSALPWHGRGQGFESPQLHLCHEQTGLPLILVSWFGAMRVDEGLALRSRPAGGGFNFVPPIGGLRTSPYGGWLGAGNVDRRTRCLDQPEQSTATARAAQISRMRVSRTRPSLLTRIVSETLSTESRFTADRRGTGSSPGSSTTSLTRPRIVVVHGAMSARRCRGMTASRESTTTGRRPISAISHHQISPRAGNSLMNSPRLV
jgi:hypothetical protein